MGACLWFTCQIPFILFFPSPFSCVGNCLEGMFLCTSEDTCIAGARRCDGIPDCAGGEDEQLCESKNVPN